MKVGNGIGRNTSFWGDAWCDQMPLMKRFPDIYDICVEQKITLADAAALNWNFYFRRWMAPDMALQIHGCYRL
jgi:hypothetical protein